MKKQTGAVLIAITLAFSAFTLGFFLGRNQTFAQVLVRVPAAMQTDPPEASTAATTPPEVTNPVSFPININSADKEAFMALPGIGEVLAQRILAYRAEHGTFSVPEELLHVEGIGEKRLEEILDLITIGGAP